jgi:DNA repair photolyase
MRRLANAGVPCGVYVAPVLPGLTDADEAIAAVAEAAREHGASVFWAGVLRLAPLVKEHYLGFVAEAFPEMLTRYERAYPGTEAPREYRDRRETRIAHIRERYGFREDTAKARAISIAVPQPRVRAADGCPGQLALALPGM